MLCNGSSSPSVLEEETDFPASTIKSSYNINQGWSRKQLLVKCFARVIKGSEARGTEWYVQAKQWDWCTSLNSHWLDHKCNPFMHVSKESSFQLERHVEGFFFFNFWQLNIIKTLHPPWRSVPIAASLHDPPASWKYICVSYADIVFD